MRGLRQCGWLAAGLSLLLLGAAPASAKDVYTLALPTYLKGCAPTPQSAVVLCGGETV